MAANFAMSVRTPGVTTFAVEVETIPDAATVIFSAVRLIPSATDFGDGNFALSIESPGDESCEAPADGLTDGPAEGPGVGAGELSKSKPMRVVSERCASTMLWSVRHRM